MVRWRRTAASRYVLIDLGEAQPLDVEALFGVTVAGSYIRISLTEPGEGWIEAGRLTVGRS